ncbi:MAG: DUF4380 domain-containing protein [Chloroflexi bacterium]|nr:DUF4380 domain-containing protein [Chloroflexota bacterium]
MITIENGEYIGLACKWISNGQIRLAVTTEHGPRAMFFGWQNGQNLFAEIPDVTIPSETGPYLLLGGHRLWHAPEWSKRTYWPEVQPITVETKANGVKVTLASDGAQIEKSMSLEMDPDRPVVKVTHTLHNTGLWPVELAPWAITQCRLGGIVILPQTTEPADSENLLPNQRYSFWPYTSFTDGRITFGHSITLLNAKAAPPTKLGYRNTRGWAGYWLDGTLFTKHFDPQPAANHPDFGCNCECYCNDRFVEVETLGALAPLKPGAIASHVETWQLRANISKPEDEAAAMAIAQYL